MAKINRIVFTKNTSKWVFLVKGKRFKLISSVQNILLQFHGVLVSRKEAKIR